MNERRQKSNCGVGIFLIAAGICCALVLPGYADVKVRRKKRDRQKTRAVVPPAPKENTKTELNPETTAEQEFHLSNQHKRLLIKYLANIDQLREIRRVKEIRAYQERLQRFEKQAVQLEKREDELLLKLRAAATNRPSGKLNFDGERLENQSGIVLPNSAASARIFTSLYDTRSLEVQNMMPKLSRYPQLLANEWIELVARIAKDSPEGSQTWRYCIRILYRSGVSRKTYEQILESLALEQNDIAALETLFFDIDAETGQLRKNITMKNLDLLKTLSHKNRSPGIRVTCAHYAVEVRDFELAGRTCSELLDQQYKGEGRALRLTLPEDRALSISRHAALILMFWGFRNEVGFNAVYDRSQIEKREIIEHGLDIKAKINWVSTTSYMAVRREMQHAKSLLRGLD